MRWVTIDKMVSAPVLLGEGVAAAGLVLHSMAGNPVSEALVITAVITGAMARLVYGLREPMSSTVANGASDEPSRAFRQAIMALFPSSGRALNAAERDLIKQMAAVTGNYDAARMTSATRISSEKARRLLSEWSVDHESWEKVRPNLVAALDRSRPMSRAVAAALTIVAVSLIVFLWLLTLAELWLM